MNELFVLNGLFDFSDQNAIRVAEIISVSTELKSSPIFISNDIIGFLANDRTETIRENLTERSYRAPKSVSVKIKDTTEDGISVIDTAISSGKALTFVIGIDDGAGTPLDQRNRTSVQFKGFVIDRRHTLTETGFVQSVEIRTSGFNDDFDKNIFNIKRKQ